MCAVQVRYALAAADARRDKTRFWGLTLHRAKSAFFARVKLWLKRTGKHPYYTSEEAVDWQNAANENRVNDSQVPDMTYTLWELANVVDDNLLNEIREIRARIQ